MCETGFWFGRTMQLQQTQLMESLTCSGFVEAHRQHAWRKLLKSKLSIFICINCQINKRTEICDSAVFPKYFLSNGKCNFSKIVAITYMGVWKDQDCRCSVCTCIFLDWNTEMKKKFFYVFILEWKMYTINESTGYLKKTIKYFLIITLIKYNFTVVGWFQIQRTCSPRSISVYEIRALIIINIISTNKNNCQIWIQNIITNKNELVWPTNYHKSIQY